MKSIFYLLILSLFGNCSSSTFNSQQIYEQAKIDFTYTRDSDHVNFKIKNPLYSPVRVSITSSDEIFSSKIPKISLQALSDTVFSMQHKDIENIDIFHGWNFGDINKVIVQENLDLPFDKNKEYKIIQGFNGSFSHNDEYSMYAIDFNLKVNDTVRSADNGYVVGVVNQNKIFGNDKKFRDYSNFITIYNNKTGIYTQYVHLKFNGTFVKVGDQVKRGQAIAQTGLSGYMDGEHLHFNVLIPNNKSLQSIPINFENYKGADLKSGDKVKH